MKNIARISLAFIASIGSLLAQVPISDSLTLSTPLASSTADKKWYDVLSIRGYMSARYNRLLETNPNLKCESCDRSWGNNGGISLRRFRVVLSGQISPRVSFLLEPDFVSSASSTALGFTQIKDAFFTIGLDKKSDFKLRIGQTKVPYGFENLQSSSVRIPLDYDDAMNSAVPGEQDMGVFLFWTPSSKKKLYNDIRNGGLKGSGDYGIINIGFYNGQSLNRPELNNSLYMVTRLTYPVVIGHQVMEPGIQAYHGKFVIPIDQISKGNKYKADRSYIDQRIAASFILRPKPWGIQAEYNIGRGPEFNTTSDSIETRSLKGGYITLSYMANSKKEVFIPYMRYQTYNGGKKAELDARSHRVKELEIGMEWQPIRQFELTAAYTIASRRFEDFILQNNLQKGRLMRLQAQVNF